MKRSVLSTKLAMILTTVNATKENKGKDIKLESNTDKPNHTNKSTHVKNGKVIKHETITKSKSDKSEVLSPKNNINKIIKQSEELPEAVNETHKEVKGNLYVNYQSSVLDNIEHYPLLRFPKKGCVIRTYRFGSTKRRGFKEDSFQISIESYFGLSFIVWEVRLNTGKETRPFEPDIAIIAKKSKNNIRIDVEIDEPYAGITRQPTHCKGDDILRDTYFIDRGWIALGFLNTRCIYKN